MIHYAGSSSQSDSLATPMAGYGIVSFPHLFVHPYPFCGFRMGHQPAQEKLPAELSLSSFNVTLLVLHRSAFVHVLWSLNLLPARCVCVCASLLLHASVESRLGLMDSVHPGHTLSTAESCPFLPLAVLFSAVLCRQPQFSKCFRCPARVDTASR